MNYQDALVKVIEGTGTPSAEAKTLANAIMQSPFVKEITNDFVSLAGERDGARIRASEAEESIKALRQILINIVPEHAVCPNDGEFVSFDEDGCCTGCGADVTYAITSELLEKRYPVK